MPAPGASELRIAHISDLHFTSKMDWRPYASETGAQQHEMPSSEPWAMRLAYLKQDLESIKPHLVLVTGDIADNPLWEISRGSLVEAWANARFFLEDLAKATIGPDFESRVFVVPGNHDAKVLGNVRRDELKRVAGSRLFRFLRWPLKFGTRLLLRFHGLGALETNVDPLFDRELTDSLQRLPKNEDGHRAFTEAFQPYTGSRYIEELGIFVFCVNSNSRDDTFLNFAQGVVPSSEALAVATEATHWERDYRSLFKAAPKLLLLHHHPLPMPLNEGAGGPIEADQFHLLRNAGGFLRTCVDLGIDFVFHGHKHTSGCSTIAFPEHGESKQIVVLGAASIQQPHQGECSYNLVRRRTDGAWQLEVRRRIDQADGVSLYAPRPACVLHTVENARRREIEAVTIQKRVRRIDRLVTIEEDGDVEIWMLYHQLAPIVGELDAEEFFLRSTANRATWEPLNFSDESDAPNIVSGRVEIRPPARPDSPQNVEIGVRGVGVQTFSREYCHRYNSTSREAYFFRVKPEIAQEAVHLDLALPDDLVPDPEPRLEVFRIIGDSRRSDLDFTVDELVRAGRWVRDRAEEDVCVPNLRFWAGSHRILLDITSPLPGRVYRVSWNLPEDEFQVLSGQLEELREPVREAIRRLKESLLGMGRTERKSVQEFLVGLGNAVKDHFGQDEPLRVDLAVDDGNGMNVVEAVQLEQGAGWAVSPLRPLCPLGQTLRGKAFLHRTPRSYAPGIPDSKKDPNRDPMERVTQHQLALPLVFPPELPYWPRVGVLTLSSERAISALFEQLEDGMAMEWLIARSHERLLVLARELDVVFPEVPGAV